MAKTINSYLPDRGEFIVTITAGDVTAIGGAITQADTVNIDGALRKLEETSPRSKEYSEVFVTGSSNPIKTMSTKINATVWTLMLVDDFSKGDAGEWGLDNLSALEIFQLFFDNDRIMSALLATPAGGTAGMIQTTLANVDIQSITHPPIDADSSAPNEVTIQLIVESFTKAAHA